MFDMASELQDFGYVALAGVLGALIGFERELADKPAGLRTHIFVAAASALFVILGNGVVDVFDGREAASVINADPPRIVQAVVIGISFLGAGTIVHRSGTYVEGLTTAASIFLTAGIGVAVAVDRIWLAVATSVFAVFMLIAVGWIEQRFIPTSLAGSDSASSMHDAQMPVAREEKHRA